MIELPRLLLPGAKWTEYAEGSNHLFYILFGKSDCVATFSAKGRSLFSWARECVRAEVRIHANALSDSWVTCWFCFVLIRIPQHVKVDHMTSRYTTTKLLGSLICEAASQRTFHGPVSHGAKALWGTLPSSEQRDVIMWLAWRKHTDAAAAKQPTRYNQFEPDTREPRYAIIMLSLRYRDAIVIIS